MTRRYDGPMIDAHHHLWDLSLGRHPWITSDESSIKALGDISFLRRDYLTRDYLEDAGAQKIVGSVYIEALWDRARPPEEEIAWVNALEKPPGIASRCVAWADLTAPDVDDVLARLAARGTVAGVRETIRWHPDPVKCWTRAGIVDDPAWRRGFSRLRQYGFLLEVLMNPYQAEEIANLAGDFPDQMIVVNHCGTPVDRDAEGLARWRAGLAAMAARPNVALKISNYGNYAADRGPAALSAVVMTCLDAFGATRALFGTDYPVARRNMSFDAICERLKDVLVPLSDTEQRAVFHDNVARLYGFEEPAVRLSASVTRNAMATNSKVRDDRA